MLHKTYILFLAVMLSLVFGSAYGQKRTSTRKAKTTVKKKSAAKEQPATPVNTAFLDMLPSTAKLCFIDSVVCDKDDILKNIPLSKDNGKLVPYNTFFNTNSAENTYVYVNDFADQCFYSKTDSSGNARLYRADCLAGVWQAGVPIDFGPDFSDVRNPYLMPDGLTLYFSARNTESVGDHDIYVTRFDRDSLRFFTPTNIGLPYNSEADDIFCITDEGNNLAWLVTTRNQQDGNVCIYTFVPSTERWTDSAEQMPETKLESYARLSSIKDTWTDQTTLNSALTRLTALKSKSKGGETTRDILFVVNDSTVYHSLGDFKSPTSIMLYQQLEDLRKDFNSKAQETEALRQQYASAEANKKKSLAREIIRMEQYLEKAEKDIKDTEKKIRNTENLL